MTSPLIRPPREWDECCTTCNGTGTVHCKQSFQLWTPDEWQSPFGPPKPIAGAPADAYVCVVQSGSTIVASCREGVEISVTVGRPVAFEFNDTLVVCRAWDDPRDLAAKWSDDIHRKAARK